MKIGFLHTSPVHIETFEKLLSCVKPSPELHHLVDEELLANAINNGITQEIEDRVEQYLVDLAKAKCSVIVCTCSTLGGIAEDIDFPQTNVIRIDRPMAKKAVATSQIILMVAVLKSTLLPTRRLLEDESRKQKRPLRIQELVIEDAWEHFLKGDLQAYHQHIGGEIKKALTPPSRCDANPQPESIVLAQASMAGASSYLEAVTPTIFSSPAECVNYLIEELNG